VFGAGGTGYSNVGIADVQMYNQSLTKTQVGTLYYRGIYGNPINNSGLVGWWPMLGSTNDYSSSWNIAFPYNVSYSGSSYLPIAMKNSYQIGKATIPMQLNSNGIEKNYNVSVVIWNS
jgi:hypothetical protein